MKPLTMTVFLTIFLSIFAADVQGQQSDRSGRMATVRLAPRL